MLLVLLIPLIRLVLPVLLRFLTPLGVPTFLSLLPWPLLVVPFSVFLGPLSPPLQLASLPFYLPLGLLFLPYEDNVSRPGYRVGS